MRFLFVCLIGLLVSVEAHPVSSPVISGQVRLVDGSPVAGAQVVLFDLGDLRRGPVGQATTDEAGQFALPLTAAGGALMLPQEFCAGGKLSQSVQSFDDHTLSASRRPPRCGWRCSTSWVSGWRRWWMRSNRPGRIGRAGMARMRQVVRRRRGCISIA